MVGKWQDKQLSFEDYVTKPCSMYILWEHRAKCLNVWPGRLEDLESECSAHSSTTKTVFAVGDVGSSKGAIMVAGDEPVDWIMAQGLDEGQTEVSRKSVAVGKEYDRIQREGRVDPADAGVDFAGTYLGSPSGVGP